MDAIKPERPREQEDCPGVHPFPHRALSALSDVIVSAGIAGKAHV